MLSARPAKLPPWRDDLFFGVFFVLGFCFRKLIWALAIETILWLVSMLCALPGE